MICESHHISAVEKGIQVPRNRGSRGIKLPEKRGFYTRAASFFGLA
jgi:hypothetical protein